MVAAGLVGGCCLLAGGCASGRGGGPSAPIGMLPNPPPSTASVYVFRPRASFMFASDVALLINGQYVGDLKDNEYIRCDLPPGFYVFETRPAWWDINRFSLSQVPVEMEVAADTVYFVEYAYADYLERWESPLRLVDGGEAFPVVESMRGVEASMTGRIAPRGEPSLDTERRIAAASPGGGRTAAAPSGGISDTLLGPFRAFAGLAGLGSGEAEPEAGLVVTEDVRVYGSGPAAATGGGVRVEATTEFGTRNREGVEQRMEPEERATGSREADRAMTPSLPVSAPAAFSEARPETRIVWPPPAPPPARPMPTAGRSSTAPSREWLGPASPPRNASPDGAPPGGGQATTTDEVMDQLWALKDLYDQRIITEEEYEVRRRALIDRFDSILHLK